MTVILSSDLYSNLVPRSLLSLAARDESVEVENGSVYRESCQSSKFRPVNYTRTIFLDGTWCQHESTNDVAKIEGERKRSLASPILSFNVLQIKKCQVLEARTFQKLTLAPFIGDNGSLVIHSWR